MKKQLLFIFAAIIIASGFMPLHRKPFVPPGTVKINDTLYADETEISNFSWNEYESWIKNKYGSASEEYRTVLRDTNVWEDASAYCAPYVHYYHHHPAYFNYPVVGISYEQALAYCKWRSERVKEHQYVAKNYAVPALEYRLPTKEEWEFLSNNGGAVFYNNGFNAKGLFKANVINERDSGKVTSYKVADVTAPVYSYWKNSFGLFDMIGNVSEMVMEKGTSKGGSWRHRLEDCRTGKDICYDKPTAWLGFRCVCIVKPAAKRISG